MYMVGDLKYGRTVHSLLMAMRHFNPTFHFIAPRRAEDAGRVQAVLRHSSIENMWNTPDFTADTIAGADILYMTRVQKGGLPT